MSNDISSSNSKFLKSLQNTVMNDSWLEGMYSTTKANQKNELKKIFAVVADNDLSASEKSSLESKAESINEKIERIEAKMAVLAENLQSNSEELEKQAKAIEEMVFSVESKSTKLEEDQKKVVSNAIDDVFYLYKKGNIGKDAISGEIQKRVRNNVQKLSGKAEIEKILSKMNSKQSELSSLSDGAAKLLEQKNLLDSQYATTKTTYDLLSSNLSKIGNTNSSYSNNDLDSKIPVFSFEKTDIVADIFENPNYNVASGLNTNYIEGSSQGQGANGLSQVVEKYGITGNENFSQLKSHVDSGLLEDLGNLGLSQNELAEFFGRNYSNADIQYSSGGSFSIPNGMTTDTRDIYGKITNFINSSQKGKFQGELNTWDKEKGNTISSNKQIASLADNFDAVYNKLTKEEPKFTFKEVMYVLFDKDKGLFKDSGINYDYKDQEGGKNFTISPAGDKKTSDLYEKINNTIKNDFGVGGNEKGNNSNTDNGINNGGNGSNTGSNDNTTDNVVINRTDPLSFKKDGIEYTFVIDRDSNSKFDGTSEFVGADSSKTWLDDLKSLDANNDGVLSKDELENLKLMGTSIQDNTEFTTNYNTNNIGYTMSSAASMGIEEINLNGLEDKVNQDSGKTDINNSELFNDSFSFKIDGQEYSATRKDDTSEYMNTIYQDAQGKSFSLGSTEEEVENKLKENYNTNSKYGDINMGAFTSNLNVVKGVAQTTETTKGTYEKAMDRIEENEKSEIRKAANKAAAETQGTAWSSIQSEIISISSQEGIVVDMEQAKGYYVLDGSLSAKDIVDKCKEQAQKDNELQSQQKISKESWKAIMLCAQNGFEVSSDEIMDMLKSGEAKTAQDIVNILKEREFSDENN